MLKDKEKEALESLKQIYLENREEKTRIAKERFFGFFLFRKKGLKENLSKYYLNKRERSKNPPSSPLVIDRKKFNNYKIE